MVDWTLCPDVEQKLDVMFGAFVVRGTRVPVKAVLDNAADGYTAEQIATEIYHGLPIELACRVIEFARKAQFAAHTA